MTVVVDSNSAVPPFEQVRTQLADQINRGALPVGARLPTVRRLAADLGIAANTVARSYRELEAAGLLETRGRAGTFVAAGEDNVKAKAAEAAAEYARIINALGIDREQAIAIVQAAFDAR